MHRRAENMQRGQTRTDRGREGGGDYLDYIRIRKNNRHSTESFIFLDQHLLLQVRVICSDTGWLEVQCHYYCMRGAILTAASSTLNRNDSSLRINWFYRGHVFLCETAKGFPEDLNWNWGAERPHFAGGIQNSDVKAAVLFWTEKWMRRPHRGRSSGTQACSKGSPCF